ncbi:MAG: phospho-N-acetylmuramoyl-pentapeptide-transferase [Firmicutes bacterium]|nr:phospho-N-acetylmuramoyl-pentapeptide-transferase [Bacillota bacterium]MCM1401074.1 phospho-N-acetylmuramoyl-pentapeptide-transferase [Bacteroides sp.]MCM1476993.1 phospho-N-acetylmuramoyl-pentapeptide-transferase [Bacteroides sp.]
MLYYIFELLKDSGLPGVRLMDYITFRSGASFVLALFIALVFGRKIIDRLRAMQVGEIVRDLGIQGENSKKGTPTMGGIIIILSILVPCLLLGDLTNVYMLLMIISTIWLGILGFLDDFLKLKRHNKDGMKGKFKIIGQLGLGLIVGLTMWLSPDIVVRENVKVSTPDSTEQVVTYRPENVKSPQTTIPFVKNNNFDYQWLTKWAGKYGATAGWIVFVIITILVVMAISNGANLTDGIDGLCAGTSAIIGVALLIMAYLGGHVVYASYLNILYIPESAELVVFMAAFIGALTGFLWYNANPAQVFMGDTGSLTIGGIIAVFAILTRKELLTPILCGVFLVENLSVMIQVGYYKYSRKKHATPRRVFKCTPLHHHFQKSAADCVDVILRRPFNPVPEQKLVVRFWIVAILLAAITFVTLKIR